MWRFIENPAGTYDLVNERSGTEYVTTIRALTLDEMGEIVIAAVSVINPAMGDMLRGLLAQEAQ